MGPRDVEIAGRFALVADCCGAPFYVMTPSSAPGQDGSSSFAALPRSGSCGWNELCADHPGKALDFYSRLFGWTLPDAMDMGALGTYQFIAHDGTMIGAIMQRPDPVPAPAWAHYFWVESIVAAKARIDAAGGHVVNGPSEVPGPLWVIQALDPQGAPFSLVGGK
jgi:predicted enzyme related to lactoylglutathione lyase